MQRRVHAITVVALQLCVGKRQQMAGVEHDDAAAAAPRETPGKPLMSRRKSIALTVAAFLTGAFLTWLILLPLGDRFIPLLLTDALEDIYYSDAFGPILLVLTVAGGAICAALAWQCAQRSVSVTFVRTLFAIYIVAGFLIIMGKKSGTSALNLDILDLIDQLTYSLTIVALNVAIFVPLGILLYSFHSAWKAFGLALAVDVGMEAAQYLFGLSIADVVDVLTNMTGFTIGYLIAVLFHRFWHVEREGGRYLIIPVDRGAAKPAAA